MIILSDLKRSKGLKNKIGYSFASTSLFFCFYQVNSGHNQDICQNLHKHGLHVSAFFLAWICYITSFWVPKEHLCGNNGILDFSTLFDNMNRFSLKPLLTVISLCFHRLCRASSFAVIAELSGLFKSSLMTGQLRVRKINDRSRNVDSEK